MKPHRYIPLFIVMMLIGCLLFPTGVQAAETESATFTIQQAIDDAYLNSKDLKNAELEVEIGKIQRDNAAKSVTGIPSGGLVSSSYQSVVNAYQQADISLNAKTKSLQAAKPALAMDVVSAYISVLTAYNAVQSATLDLQNLNDQKRIVSLSKSVGLTSSDDYTTLLESIKQAEDGLEAKKLSYKSAVASLANLVGENKDWNPSLTSKATLNQYARDDLSVELSRALGESVALMQQQASYDAEESKQNWVLTGTDSGVQRRNLSIAQNDLEQAKLDVSKSLEQLYYSIDAKEKEIEVNKTALQTAQRDLQTAQLKYSLGLIPNISATGESLSAAKIALTKAEIKVDDSCAGLVNLKAQFAYTTGKTVYDPTDWASLTATAVDSTTATTATK